MKTPIFKLLIVLCVASLSCQQTAEKYTKSIEEKVEIFEKSANDGSWLQKLMATEPYTEEELLSKLPKQLTDLPLRSTNSPAAQTASGTYSTSDEPSHQTANITIRIIDGAGNYGFGHLNAIHKMISMEVNNQETNGWTRTQQHKGNRILLKEATDRDIQFSELEYIKDNRYHITLSGKRFDSNQLLQAKDELEKITF